MKYQKNISSCLKLTAMPKQERTIAILVHDTDTALALSYQAFKDLGWDILFAGEDKILAQTAKKWNSNPQHVIVFTNGNELTVTSEMIKDELVDITGKNKKNIATFIQALEAAQNNTQAETLEINKQAVKQLRTATEISVQQEIKETEEVDKAMNLTGSNLYLTYSIIAVNVLIFILMVANGAGIIDLDGLVHIKWGSNYRPLTLTGDWWRLISNVFIHFGIIHLVMNMYCLYMVGIFLEPMLGKIKFMVAYLCTGVLASIVSLWWHNEAVNSAGASGAIFGLYGLFLALLTTKLIPEKIRNSQLKTIGIFVAYNLIYGMKGGIDNAAHIGGLISGFIVGYLYAFQIKKEKEEQQTSWVLPAVLIITVGITIGFLNSNKEPESKRTAVLSEIKAMDYKDAERFNDKFNEMVVLQDKAIAVFNEGLDDEALQKKLVEVSRPLWDQAALIGKEMQGMNTSNDMHKKADAVVEYVDLRKKEIDIFTEIVIDKSVVGEQKFKNVRNKIMEVLERLK